MKLSFKIDRISFEIGMINCFIEMVSCGVKPLAISPPIDPKDLPVLEEASKIISSGFATKYYIEHNLIITDIQSEAFTKGKHSILYYSNDEVLAQYLSLKKTITELEKQNLYTGQQRKDLSYEFGRLLGYPEDVLKKKIDGSARIDPFILDI